MVHKSPIRAVKKSPKKAIGSRAQVWHGTADHTSGGLRKDDLMKSYGRIVSVKKHAAGKKAYQKNCAKMADPYAPKSKCHAIKRKH